MRDINEAMMKALFNIELNEDEVGCQSLCSGSAPNPSHRAWLTTSTLSDAEVSPQTWWAPPVRTAATLPGERVDDRRRVAALAMGLRLPFAGDIDREFAPLALRVNLPIVLGDTAYDHKHNPSREERHDGATSPRSFRRTPIVHHCSW
jgi:hypothetical protein